MDLPVKTLGEFSRDRPTLSAPELARRFDLPRSTVFRLLTTLENMGFIERADGGRDYRLGLAVLRLGFEYLNSLELTERGQPLLRRLCDEIRYPCNLGVRDGRSIVYVAKVSPQEALQKVASEAGYGRQLPDSTPALNLYLDAKGKWHLAYVIEDVRSRQKGSPADHTPLVYDYVVDARNRFTATYEYVVGPDGRLHVHYAYAPSVEAPWLPHVGMVVAFAEHQPADQHPLRVAQA